MFQGWDSFYLLIGGAAGALIGLMFVVATLTSGRDRTAASRGASIYMTPVVFHFAVVLVIGALALAPGIKTGAAGMIILACALGGLAHAVSIVVRLNKPVGPEPPHWSDVWCYGVAPAAIYVGLVGAAVAIWIAPAVAADGIAAALLALLLMSVRNAWDLVTWLAPSADKPPAP